MAKTVKIAGATYSDVPGVDLPLADNTGNARFTDTSDATATADKILSGYTAYGANGTKLTGTASSEGGGTDHDFIVTAELDPETLDISNVSHTLAEIAAAKQAGKDVRFDAIGTVEGVLQIIFSAPLVICHSFTAGGNTYYTVVFSATYIESSEHTLTISIKGTTGDNNGQLSLSYDETYAGAEIEINYSSATGVISSVSENVSWDAIASHILGREKLHVVVYKDGSSEGVVLNITSSDDPNQVVCFEGTFKGIKYTVGMQLYEDEQDIPSGSYYKEVEINEDTYYVAFTLDRNLDGISYIRVNATSTTQNNATTTTITSVDWPEALEEKLIILNKPQGTNLSIIIHETNQYQTMFFLPVQAVVYPTLDASVLVPLNGSLVHLIFAQCRIEVVSVEPQSGYYVQLSNGAYITVNCEILTT